MCVGMIGSAFAYFTDVETSQYNVFSAGTLNMQIKDNNEGFRDTPVSASFASPAGWAPGQQFTTDPVSFKNVGSIDIRYIFGRFCSLVEGDGANPDAEGIGSLNDIAKYIKFVSYSEKAANSTGGVPLDGTGPDADGFYTEWFNTANANAYLSYWSFPTVGYITLADLVNANQYGASTKTGLWFFDGGNDPTVPPLAVGGTAQIKFTFELLSTTTNAYQGDTATFRVDFVGCQTEADLDVSITEPVGP